MDSALHYTSVSHAHSLVGSINKMRLSEDLCDVTVVVGNFRIMAHRVVLSACTPYFYQMFYTTSKAPPEYRLDNVDETAFLKIIEFCYTSAISVTPDLAWPLLSAAAIVELPEICGLCCDLLASDLTLASCLAMHLSAARLSPTASAQLLKASSQFLEDNVTELSTSQQLFDLSERELVELFRSLSQQCSLACIKLATSWLSRNESSIQIKVVDELKQTCPHLDQDLTDFMAQRATLPSNQNGMEDHLSYPSLASEVVDRISPVSPHCHDSDNCEPAKRPDQAPKEEEKEEDQHICVGCGDTFLSRAELLNHRKRECEDEVTQTSACSRESALSEGAGKHEQKVWEKKQEVSNLVEGSPKGLNEATVMSDTYTETASELDKSNSKNIGISEEIDTDRDAVRSGYDEAAEANGNCAEEMHLKDPESSGSKREKPESDNQDANDSNNNDINAKCTVDADNCDDIDVVNGDTTVATTRDKHKGRRKGKSVYGYDLRIQAYSMDTQGLGQDESNALKCQFCGVSVFDDEEELATHWKEVHGVCQDTAPHHHDKARPYEPLDNITGSHSYLKRSNSDNDEQEKGLGNAYKVPVKQPKMDEKSIDKKEVSSKVKSEFSDRTGTKTPNEQWLARSGDSRAKVGEEGNVAGFLQYVQQYNELAKWYMDQGFTYCNLCLVYHAKNAQCPKSKVNSGQATSDAQEVTHLTGNETALDLKCEKNKQEQESKGLNGLDIENSEKGKKISDNGCEEEEEEGPLDMSKTSQDFASSAQFSSRYHSGKQASDSQVGNAQQDSQFLSLHQMELAQYYSRMMAAVAAVSASPGNGNTDGTQFGLPGPYGGSLPGGFSHSSIYTTPAAISTSNGGNKVAGGTGALGSSAAHTGGPEIMIYGASAASSPTGSVSNKAYGKHFRVPSDVSPYSSQPTSQSSHRRQQSFHSTPHSLQEESASLEGIHSNGLNASSSSFPLTIGGVAAPNQSSSNGKSQAKRKPGSREGFPCTVCNRVFSYQAALFTHMRVHSPSARTYQCQLCQRTFERAADLKVHVCPNGVEKPYVCPSCGQTFAKNIHLKRHLATHSGLKPYPCWVCGKRFSRSDHLKRHTQSIHAGSRPHGCQLCGKEFVRKYELNKHMLIHTNVVPGEQAETGTTSLTNNHLQTSSQSLGEATSGSPGPLTMQLPVTRSTVST